ncbi:hypothetical protein [Actinomadura opuntiae]|uniref:hypothetical protein n=1 Tax=Actinomadura sp. OS1-43 TaxID=604315 RepID=UPI00255B21E0|nr:hypothetical protein [Actinomadura sp. OS1-43]MDL4815128.1 hypothetical protein [Actinomadura sp. OS1-43]
MRVRFRFTAVWIATTAAGMAISWAGVGHALRGTTLPAPDLAADAPVQRGRPPAPPSAASPSASASAPRRSASPAASPSARATASASPSPSAPASGKVRTYVVRSGRVVLSLTSTSARLVSAVPDSGFEAKTWRKPGWLRVDLTDGAHGSAVFATWNGHPTIVQVYEY